MIDVSLWLPYADIRLSQEDVKCLYLNQPCILQYKSLLVERDVRISVWDRVAIMPVYLSTRHPRQTAFSFHAWLAR